MSDESLLRDLIDRWQIGVEQGRPPPIAELCRDHPHLRDEVEKRLDVLGHFEVLRHTRDGFSRTTTPEGVQAGDPQATLQLPPGIATAQTESQAPTWIKRPSRH